MTQPNKAGFDWSRWLAGVVLAAAMLAGGARPAMADDAATHYNLGLQYKREGKIPDAIAEVEKALKLRPSYAAALFTLGNLWRAQGNYAKAAEQYEKVVKLEPNDAMAHGNLVRRTFG